MGLNAAAYALGEMPEPVIVPTRGEAMGSRYHAKVSLIYAIETEMTSEGARTRRDRRDVHRRSSGMTGKPLTVADYPLAENRPDIVETKRAKG